MQVRPDSIRSPALHIEDMSSPAGEHQTNTNQSYYILISHSWVALFTSTGHSRHVDHPPAAPPQTDMLHLTQVS
jgi:hypothetical protein